MLKYLRRASLVAAIVLLTIPGSSMASAHTAAVTLDGLRDPAYVLLARDPSGDLAPALSGDDTKSWADLNDLYITTDTTTLWVYVDLPGYSNNSSGEFGLAIDTDGLPASGGPQDPNGNAITFAYTSTENNVGASPLITSSTLLPDVVIRGLMFSPAESPPGYTMMRHWNAMAGSWDGNGINWGGVINSSVGSHVAFAYGQGLEFAIPFADLGVPPTQALHLEFYTTGTARVGQDYGAWDTIPADDQSQMEIQATTQRRLATFDPRHPPQLPSVAFSTAAFAVTEAAGSVPITITVAPTSTDPVAVNLETADGTAGSADYVPISETVTFAAGQADQIIQLQVLTDTIAEPDETVLLDLSQPVGLRLGQPITAVLTIHDSPPASDGHPVYLPLLRK